jgi:hypothetical protein
LPQNHADILIVLHNESQSLNCTWKQKLSTFIQKTEITFGFSDKMANATPEMIHETLQHMNG